MFLRKLLTLSLLGIFTITVFGYGIYRATPIILGPKIIIDMPNNGEVVDGTSTIAIVGTVYRTKSLFINSIPTAFAQDGNFQSRLAIYPGSNIFVLQAYDRFGRSTTKTLNIGTK